MALRIALFGRATFGRELLEHLVDSGHAIAGVYTPPEAPVAAGGAAGHRAPGRGEGNEVPAAEAGLRSGDRLD
jgi:hypothetical protein